MKIVDSEKCCGCGACFNVCPKNAISMRPGKNGFLYPEIDTDLCVHCNGCIRVCPVLKEKTSVESRAFAGHWQSKSQLHISASGGAATALAELWIRQGGYVSGCAYSEDLYTAEHVLGNDLNTVEKIQGTKYIQSRKGKIYKEIKELLSSGESVMFFGLPCEVAGLKNYLNKDYSSLLCCDLICHGPTSHEVHKQFLQHYEKKFKSKCIAFNCKDKENGWEHSGIKMTFANGRTFKVPLYRSAYGDAFENMPRSSCMQCHFKGENRFSDLTLGDYWGCDHQSSVYNSDGVSFIVAHSEKGERWLRALPEEQFYLEKASTEHLKRDNPAYYKSCAILPYKSHYLEIFSNDGLFAAYRKTTPLLRKAYTSLMAILKK